MERSTDFSAKRSESMAKVNLHRIFYKNVKRKQAFKKIAKILFQLSFAKNIEKIAQVKKKL